MALEIMIVGDVSKPYWENEKLLRFGEIDPHEWESLFFIDLGVMDLTEYSAKTGGIQSYEDYYSERISQLQKKFPLLVRIKDYYQDAFFSPDEIDGLRREIASLRDIVKQQESINFLNQLWEVSDVALKNNAGVQLAAD
jgi:hypothetical protein